MTAIIPTVIADNAPLFPNTPLCLCTSLEHLQEAGACAEGYYKFAKYLKTHFPSVGKDDPVPLALALQSNDFNDVMWAAREALCGDGSRWLRELACDFAEHVLPIFEKRLPGDIRPRQCIEVARRFGRSEVTDAERHRARADAINAANQNAIPGYASYAAACAAAAAAGYLAPQAAAYAAAYADASSVADGASLLTERQWQLDRLAVVLRGD